MTKSRFNPKGRMTKVQKEWLARVVGLRCVLTRRNDVQIHHLVENGRRLGHDYVIPLSVQSHREIYKLTFAEQLELCKEVWSKLGREWVEPVTKIVRRNNG